ncbi:MAG: hypothetical protein IPJ88_00765 [Myxococcales bacterium]|nr:MAG: hypothetical protein IPJ88_00765 [Myxococcales bacterium]
MRNSAHKHTIRWCILPVLLALCLAACTDGLDKPKAPNRKAVVNAYRMPDAPLTADNAQAVEDGIEERLGALAFLCGEAIQTPNCDIHVSSLSVCTGLDVLAELLDLLANDGQIESSGDKADNLSQYIEGDGYAQVTKICGGPGEEAHPLDSNGAAELTFTFSELGIDPTLWGVFDQCMSNRDGVVREFDADLSLIFPEILAFADLNSDDAIVVYSGRSTMDGETRTLEVDFESSTSRCELVVRIPLSDGSSLLYFTRAGAVGIRAENGEWACDFQQNSCVSETDGELRW